MITDESAEKAAEFIRDNARNFGKARSERIQLEEFRKSKKALLMNQATGTDKTRESEAYAHPHYIELLDTIKLAREEEERLRWLMVAAEQTIEIWRTQQANNRRIEYSHR